MYVCVLCMQSRKEKCSNCRLSYLEVFPGLKALKRCSRCMDPYELFCCTDCQRRRYDLHRGQCYTTIVTQRLWNTERRRTTKMSPRRKMRFLWAIGFQESRHWNEFTQEAPMDLPMACGCTDERRCNVPPHTLAILGKEPPSWCECTTLKWCDSHWCRLTNRRPFGVLIFYD